MTSLDGTAPPRAGDAAKGSGRRVPRSIRPLVWRRLPWWFELALIGVGYYVYALGRQAAPEKTSEAHFHAQQIIDLQQVLRLDFERFANDVVTGWTPLAEFCGYFYGTLHFIVTPAVLIWLYFRRPGSYARLRSTIFIATGAALVCFWAWPLAPPRFAMSGITDTIVDRDIFGAGSPDGPSGMVNLYAAMPSLHCAWAIWCAVAVYLTTRSSWRRLVWAYPITTTLVVMGTGNHFLLDAVGGLAVVMLGLWLTSSRPWRGGGAVDVDEMTPKDIAIEAELGRSVAAEVEAELDLEQALAEARERELEVVRVRVRKERAALERDEDREQ
jgi:hypothetical protein